MDLLSTAEIMIKRSLGWSKQDASKINTPLKETPVPEEAEAAEPSTHLANAHGPLIVSPQFAKDITSDLPDQSTDDVASIVNGLALEDVSESPPNRSVPGKRNHQEVDEVEEPPKKRVAKGSEATETRRESPATSSNGVRGRALRSNRASSAVAPVAPGKLGRPKKQVKRHMINVQPGVQKSGDPYDMPLSPKEQVENPAAKPTKTTKGPQSSDTIPRGRGRPARKLLATTEKLSSVEEGQRKSQDLQAKVGRKRRSAQSQKDENPAEIPPQKARPKAQTQTSRQKSGDIQKGRAQISESPKELARAGAEKASKIVRKDEVDDISARSGTQHQAVGVQHEREQRNEDDPERGVDRAPEEVVDEDGQDSSSVDDDEEEDKESEVDDDEGEDKESEVELFGQDEVWSTILKGARSVCGSKLRQNQMPKLLTRSIKDLIYDIKEARQLYEQLLPLKGLDDDSLHGLNNKLEESLHTIEDRINMVSEKAAANEGPEMIKDIFACAIPAMVFLLQSALASRVYHSNEPCSLESLNEIVSGLREVTRLQQMTILLCEKARLWKAKPVSTNKPIVRPTTQQIYPPLRYMTKAFSKQLTEQDKKRKMKQNALDYSKREKELAESSQRAQQEAARRDEISQRRIRESREREDQRRRDQKRTLRQIREAEAYGKMRLDEANGHVQSKPTWSDAEDIALYFQLEKGYSGHLTSTERYLNILNTPLLQNKLPEHIRERALYFKPTLLEERGALEWISSID